MPNLVFASLTAKENPMNTPALPRYSFGEELANSLTHGLGIVLAIAGLAVLSAFATLYGGTKEVVACMVFGATLILCRSVGGWNTHTPGSKPALFGKLGRRLLPDFL
jgi:predicted membrane channel-forming protein YqfA (hemolysin III family)